MSKPERPLLLLDLNGTIVYRTEVPVNGVRAALYVRRKYSYPRVGVQQILEKLSPYYEIAVYSSVMYHNITPVLNACSINHLVDKVFDREYNIPDPQGENKWDTKRCLNKILRGARDHSLSSVILVDNEERKVQDCKQNGIVIEEYGANEVASGVSNTLDKLCNYLLALSKDWKSGKVNDVREWIREHPYMEIQEANPSLDSFTITPHTKTLLGSFLGMEAVFVRLSKGKLFFSLFNEDVSFECLPIDEVEIERKIQVSRLLRLGLKYPSLNLVVRHQGKQIDWICEAESLFAKDATQTVPNL
ncbi:hypothetical protein P9112_013121 [Eukaryota sp. TZLM1-RC]